MAYSYSQQSALKHCHSVRMDKTEIVIRFFCFCYLHYVARRKIEQTCFQASAISEMKFPPRYRSSGNFRKQIEITADASGIFHAKYSPGVILFLL